MIKNVFFVMLKNQMSWLSISGKPCMDILKQLKKDTLVLIWRMNLDVSNFGDGKPSMCTGKFDTRGQNIAPKLRPTGKNLLTKAYNQICVVLFK